MTAEPHLPPITCPTSLVASCAPLLGFTPERSLVAFIHGVPGRRAPVVLRIDLPAEGHARPTARRTALSIAGTGGDTVDSVAWVEDPDATSRDDLSSSGFLAELPLALDQVGIEIGANLSTNGRMWWSHACSDPGCCPTKGTELDPSTLTAVRAEYAYAGYAPLASRDELKARITPDDRRVAAVEQVLLHRRKARPTARWRDSQITFLTRLLMPERGCATPVTPLTESGSARVHRALVDIRVRDVVLHRLIVGGRHCHRCGEATIETLCDAVRTAPAGAGAPVATVLALVAWIRGEGALATVCVQRALEEDPGYRLAALASRLMAQGTDPRIWRASLARLPESECLRPGRR
jgi:Domain of unknown function (DUF4192)